MVTEDKEITTEEIDSYKKGIEVEFNHWIPLKRARTDEELKKLVREADMGLIYTDKHAFENNTDVTLVFMILTFLFGDSGRKKEGTRQDKIYNMLLDDEKKKYFESIGKTEEEAKKEYVESIGMIYEYLDKAMPMGINGQPCFMSCVFLSKEDTEKFWVFYGQYIKLKENMDMAFGLF